MSGSASLALWVCVLRKRRSVATPCSLDSQLRLHHLTADSALPVSRPSMPGFTQVPFLCLGSFHVLSITSGKRKISGGFSIPSRDTWRSFSVSSVSCRVFP